MDPTRRIALLLDRSLSFVRNVLRGIRAYAANRPQWIIRDGPPRPYVVSRHTPSSTRCRAQPTSSSALALLSLGNVPLNGHSPPPSVSRRTNV